MYTGIQIKPPFFEIGPKAYLYGKKALGLAQHADIMSIKYDVSIIFTPQCVDIPLLASHTRHIHIFAQHMDAIKAGRGIGTVLPEAIKEAGAQGFLLNHSEKRVTLPEIGRVIRRGDEVGLISMICADTPEQAVEIARFNPNIILAESPDLIGVGQREESDQQQIQRINQLVWHINPDILVLHGAGIKCGQDIYEVVKNGAQGSGSTSGILLADDPFAMLEEMIKAMRTAWDETHQVNS